MSHNKGSKLWGPKGRPTKGKGRGKGKGKAPDPRPMMENAQRLLNLSANLSSIQRRNRRLQDKVQHAQGRLASRTMYAIYALTDVAGTLKRWQDELGQGLTMLDREINDSFDDIDGEQVYVSAADATPEDFDDDLHFGDEEDNDRYYVHKIGNVDITEIQKAIREIKGHALGPCAPPKTQRQPRKPKETTAVKPNKPTKPTRNPPKPTKSSSEISDEEGFLAWRQALEKELPRYISGAKKPPVYAFVLARAVQRGGSISYADVTEELGKNVTDSVNSNYSGKPLTSKSWNPGNGIRYVLEKKTESPNRFFVRDPSLMNILGNVWTREMYPLLIGTLDAQKAEGQLRNRKLSDVWDIAVRIARGERIVLSSSIDKIVADHRKPTAPGLWIFETRDDGTLTLQPRMKQALSQSATWKKWLKERDVGYEDDDPLSDDQPVPGDKDD